MNNFPNKKVATLPIVLIEMSAPKMRQRYAVTALPSNFTVVCTNGNYVDVGFYWSQHLSKALLVASECFTTTTPNYISSRNAPNLKG